MGTPRFTPEFKEEAVRQITERGYSVAEVSDRLGVSAHSLYKWLRAIKPDNSEQHARDLLEAKSEILKLRAQLKRTEEGTVAKLAMRQPFVLFKGLTFQKLCLPGAFRPGDHHNKMLRPGLCVMHASPQYL